MRSGSVQGDMINAMYFRSSVFISVQVCPLHSPAQTLQLRQYFSFILREHQPYSPHRSINASLGRRWPAISRERLARETLRRPTTYIFEERRRDTMGP